MQPNTYVAQMVTGLGPCVITHLGDAKVLTETQMLSISAEIAVAWSWAWEQVQPTVIGAKVLPSLDGTGTERDPALWVYFVR
jgi:hypothetical protein